MSIRKRTWLAPDGTERQSWQCDYRDAAGKRRSKQFDRKRDAEAHLDAVKGELREGTHVHAKDSITVSEAADLLVAHAEANDLERSTVDRYRAIGNLHIKPRIGAKKLSDLTKPMVEELRLELLRDLSRPMAGKVLAHLSMIINRAMDLGKVGKNVAKSVRVTKSKRDVEKVVPPDRADLKKMIKAATDNERALIMMAITTGLRSSELRGLRWADIDLKGAKVTVSQRADQWGVIGPPKSEAGRRTIPIPPQLVAELKRWKLKSPPSSLDLAFPSSTGTPLRHNNLLRRTYFPLQVRAGLGVPKITKAGEPMVDEDGAPVLTGKYGFHQMRHAAASGWIANLIDLKRLQVWMGHENIETTINIYGHLLVDQGRDAELAKRASRDLFA
jgi:integrase